MSTDGPPLVVLFTANPELEGLQGALGARGLHVVRVETVDAGRDLLATERPRAVAVLDTFRPSTYSFAAVYRLLHQDPPVPTLVLLSDGPGAPPVPRDDSALDDYARMPARLDELVLRVQALVLRAGMTLPEAAPPAAATAAAPPAGAPRLRSGEVIVMFGPKGGVGRSTIATNLAVGLAQRYGKQVVLVDADLWFGDVSVLLDLRGERSFATLVDHGDQLDVDVLSNVLVPHSSGIKALLAPPDPALVETIPPFLPARVATAYRALFDYVIVDTHPSMEEYMLQLLEVADRILLVTTPELSSIRNTGQVLKLASTLRLHDKLAIVLNRANSGVQLEHLEQTLGVRVDHTIVSAGPRVVEAANQGLPVLLMDPGGREQITRDLGRLVAKIAGEPEPQWDGKQAAPRRSRWRPRWAG
ncbi:MAG TPA: AAA family ATPase [Chloroflexota bacterium]|nr:AAA family ATPase [Chloroflexota bacterium]